MLTVLLAAALTAAPMTQTLDDEERKKIVAAATPEELDQAMRETPVKELIQMGQRAVAAMGTYSYKMKKQERVGGDMLPFQEIATTIREAPFAVRLDFVGGPGKGRRLVFNPSVRKTQFRVREPGILGVLGALWIDVDSGLAKKDSNHTVKEAGMGNLLSRFMRDYDKAAPMGGFGVKHEGWNKQGHYCSMWTSPNKGAGFDSATSRICTDLKTGVPAKVETWDPKGVALEVYEFSDVKKATATEETFKPENV
jgi:hypothetical protein